MTTRLPHGWAEDSSQHHAYSGDQLRADMKFQAAVEHWEEVALPQSLLAEFAVELRDDE